jgi:hypothetical protein
MAVAVHHDEEMAYVPLHIGYVRRSAVRAGGEYAECLE